MNRVNRARKESAILHGTMAFIGLTLFHLVFVGWVLPLWFITFAYICCLAGAIFYGWCFGGWYCPVDCEPPFFEVFLVTPLVSFLSTLSSGFLVGIAAMLGVDDVVYGELGEALVSSVTLGFMAFIYSLPGTAMLGLIGGVFLNKRFQSEIS